MSKCYQLNMNVNNVNEIMYDNYNYFYLYFIEVTPVTSSYLFTIIQK